MKQSLQKSALGRHMDTSAAHAIAIEHHKPITSQLHQEVFIKYFVKQSCTQRSCAFLYKGQNETPLFSTAISPEKKDEQIWERDCSLALTKTGYVQ